MGCDIHLYVEVLPEGNEGASEHGSPQWVHVPGCAWYAKDWATAERMGRTVSELPCFDPGRNYYLFALLANVRNDGSIVPLLIQRLMRKDAQPPTDYGNLSRRGLPRGYNHERDGSGGGELSDFVKARAWDIGVDGHSSNWLTLRELQEYPWDAEEDETGYVDLLNYRLAKTKGRPGRWYSELWHGCEVVTEDQMADIASRGVDENIVDRRVTKLTWKQTPRLYCAQFVDEILPELAKLSPNPDRVRIVFWFDN